MSDNWHNWPRKRFVELPQLEWTRGERWWRSILFFPTRKMHDSGYTAFAIVGVDDDGPRGRLATYDVLNLWTLRGEESYLNIDCLWPSGVFNLWSYDGLVSWDYGRVKTKPREKVPR
jgi:hypothetical protein